MLAQYAQDRLLLLDMGSHEIVSMYGMGKLRTDRSKHDDAPAVFRPDQPSKFFVSHRDRKRSVRFGAELTGEWIYVLDKQQQGVLNDIADCIIDDDPRPHFIAGGPGTGKTCILINLLRFFLEEGWDVRISVSEDLASYLDSCTGGRISELRTELGANGPADLLLVDDPDILVRGLFAQASQQARHLVIACDPLQLRESVTDSALEAELEGASAVRYMLTVCYRQKAKVGEKTKQAIDSVAKSTPYLATDKIEDFRHERRNVTELFNTVEFVNPGGHVAVYNPARLADLRNEIKWISDRPDHMWRHWPGLLVAGTDCWTPGDFVDTIFSLLNHEYIRNVSAKALEEIKGLEFQHAFLFISQFGSEALESGFRGSGVDTYEMRRRLRIPFSRAKDSLVIFAVGEEHRIRSWW